MDELKIKKLNKNGYEGALSLIWNVFQEYEAPDYSQEGSDEFHKSLQSPTFLSMLTFYGAFCGDKLVGVIATRKEGSHIALFFVDGKYHRKGIGRRLFQTVLGKCSADTMTVNSSPYAVPVYHRLGFIDVDNEQVVNGIRFTPMEHKVRVKTENRVNCPCKRIKCVRHGNCEACRSYHANSKWKCACEQK